MVVHIEFEAVYVDGKRFVHARQVFPSELYKKAVAWRILELGQADKLRERKRKAQQAEQQGKQTIQQMFAAAAIKKQKQQEDEDFRHDDGLKLL
jgi:hypothetical protein